MARLYGVRALVEWCRMSVSGYPGLHITNMSSDWRDGRAFCALIHRYRPDLVDFNMLDRREWSRNCKLAFDIAAKELDTAPILAVEDVVGEDNPDPLSIMTYVSQLYHGLAPHRGRVGAVHSLMFCRERDKPIERDNPFREEMLEWMKKKDKSVLNVKRCQMRKEIINIKSNREGSIINEIARSIDVRKCHSKHAAKQSHSLQCQSYPRPYQPIAITNPTSILSETSKHLQTLRRERNVLSNPPNNKKSNLLSTSRDSKEEKKETDCSEPDNISKQKRERNENIKKKPEATCLGLNISLGANIFHEKIRESRTILKFSLPFF